MNQALFVDITYSMSDLLSDLNNYKLSDRQTSDMRQIR